MTAYNLFTYVLCPFAGSMLSAAIIVILNRRALRRNHQE